MLIVNSSIYGVVAAGGAKLLFEVALAPGGSLLGGTDGLADVAAGLQRRDAVRDAGREAGHLLHRPRDRHAHGPHRRVRAVRHVHCAVRHLVHLVQLHVHLVDALADLVDDRQQFAFRSLDERGKAREGSAQAHEHVRETGSDGDQEGGEGVVGDVAGAGGKELHAENPSRDSRTNTMPYPTTASPS